MEKLTTLESDVQSKLCLAAQKVPPHSCVLHILISLLLIRNHSCYSLPAPGQTLPQVIKPFKVLSNV